MSVSQMGKYDLGLSFLVKFEYEEIPFEIPEW